MYREFVGFADRAEAGRLLARRLQRYADRDDVMVLALPRGGVAVGFEIATALHVPLDVFLSRKLGAPGHEEFALGAVSSGGIRVLNPEAIQAMGVSKRQLDAITAREQYELERREQIFRGPRPLPDLTRHTVILVDDGIATGSSIQAAVVGLRELHPARVVVAVPVAPSAAILYLRSFVDEIVCLASPTSFRGVGEFFQDFSQLTDQEVRGLLIRADELLHQPQEFYVEEKT